ncbi:MAG: glycosyltransferase family 2 protein [Firmicutes bacterium]|nr:glycosyltransferase family 2 protein [Bacillota bacterium]
MTVSRAISFIIPVYNVEKYLNECVDSILSQFTDECEIILVDDGSIDRSGIICDEYANRNPKIKVVHQKNSGLANARNTGLSKAEGEFVAFIDSDDYIADGCMNQILKWIDKGGADICFMSAVKIFPDGSKERLDDELETEKLKRDKQLSVQYLSERSKYPGSPCTKLFRRALIEKNNLRFPEDGRVSEDLGFVLQCILKAESYDTLSMEYYFYRQGREGSITNTVTYKSFLGLQAFLSESVELLTEKSEPKGVIEKYAMAFVAYEYSIMLWQYGYIPLEYKKKAKKCLNQYRWVISYGKTKKIKMVRIALTCLGIENTSKLLGKYMKLR